jgi:ElaB/YqjD/DUF883 family membrane-anchored ribosome-binding protein
MATEGMRNEGRETEGGLREGIEQVGQRMREGYQSMEEAVGSGYRRAERLVGRYPAPSVLIGFGLGFGLGLMLTVAVTQREEPSWRHWSLSDSLRHLHDRLAQVQDRLIHRS